MAAQVVALVIALPALVIALRSDRRSKTNQTGIEQGRQDTEVNSGNLTYLNRENDKNPATENVPTEIKQKVNRIANGHGAPEEPVQERRE